MQMEPTTIKPLPNWVCYVTVWGWLTLCFLCISIFVSIDLGEAEDGFIHQSREYADKLNRDYITNETILKGFSALFSAVGKSDPETVARYVRDVIKENHQIFSLEISQRVARAQVETFSQGMRTAGVPDFRIKSFSYDSARSWQVPPEKDFYYPIIFMEPFPSGSQEILGLDIDSVPFLRDAMLQSLATRSPVPTHPFKLVEGNWAYVTFCPIPAEKDMIVDMVIDAANLSRPDKALLKSGFSAGVYHKDFHPNDGKGQLFSASGLAKTALEASIFPVYSYKEPLASTHGSFFVATSRQTGWSDLNVGLIALMGTLAILSSSFLLALMRSIQRQKQARIDQLSALWKSANYDALTGIPNRMLMKDRLEQAMALSERDGQYGAIIFVDLDRFKHLNDTRGHDAGDMLLIEVARRIKDCIREIDTVARLGGDEFIVILSELGDSPDASENAAAIVADKVCQSIAQPFQLHGFNYHTTASLGITIFKGNQCNINELIKSADQAMYRVKMLAHANRQAS